MSIIIVVLFLCVLRPIESKSEFQMKFLFADAIFSYNLNNLIVEDQPKQTLNQTTFVSANMLPGSFICFILARNDMEIEMNGGDKNKFSLEFEKLGSTSLLIDTNERKPVFKLYSLKLSEFLSEKNIYELKFKLIDKNKILIGLSSWLTININSTDLLNGYEHFFILY